MGPLLMPSSSSSTSRELWPILRIREDYTSIGTPVTGASAVFSEDEAAADHEFVLKLESGLVLDILPLHKWDTTRVHSWLVSKMVL